MLGLRIIVLSCLAAACGPSTPGDDGSESAGQGTQSSATEASSEPSSESGADSTTAPATSGVLTTADATSSDGAASTGGDGVTYRAVALPTGVPRIRITKQDGETGVCTWIGLAFGPAGRLGIGTPQGWAVEEAGINDVAESCDSDNPSMSGGVAAVAGEGAIVFETPKGLLPEQLDIDVELTFDTSIEGTPLLDVLTATAIVVEFE